MKEGIEAGAADAVGAVTTMGENLKTEAETAGTNTKDAFKTNLEPIVEETQGVVNDVNDAVTNESDGLGSLPSKAQTIGGDIVDGMISGLESKEGQLYSKIGGMVEQAMQAAQKPAEVNSPSKRTMRLFESVGDGTIVGLENKREKIKKTTEDVVNRALEFNALNKNAVEKLISSIN